jgi:glycosyltransferase 2 family protein
MRVVKLLLLVGGVVALGILIAHIGWDAIRSSLGQLSWWRLLLACLPYALIMAVDTLGWRYAFAQDRVPFLRLFGARVVGEALNVLTALGSVGGEAVKAWLVRRDVPYEESVPSVVIAKTTITIAQALFLLLGIGLAWATLSMDSRVLRGMLWLLVVEILAVGGFFLTQVTGLVARVGRSLTWFGVSAQGSYAEGLDIALRTFYRQHWQRFAVSVGFHFLGWVLGALETFLMLYLLAIPVGVLTATVIEAFGSGVRFATFLVPASIGALEGANAGAFVSLGLGASAGLAFSLLRRARQVVWIAAGLVILVVMRSSGWLADARRSIA